jgi:hypothetical protein
MRKYIVPKPKSKDTRRYGWVMVYYDWPSYYAGEEILNTDMQILAGKIKSATRDPDLEKYRTWVWVR